MENQTMPKQKLIPYNKKLKQRARHLRNSSTLAEVLLWNQLKRRQVRDCQFLRQKPLDNYIVDFFCKELMLAIEIDGVSHNEKIEYDERRQKRLESLGIRFLRFQDTDVLRNLEGVLSGIEMCIEELERRDD